MIKRVYRAALFAVLSILLVVWTGCTSSPDPNPGAGGTSGTGTSGTSSAGTGGAGTSAAGTSAAGTSAAGTGGAGTSTAGTGGAGTGGSMDASSTSGTGAGGGAVTVTLSDSSFTLDTPDLSKTVTAVVTGSADTTVTWSSSDTYIATVSSSGVVTSVSGGQATVTATSVADATKKATCTVTVAEPNRAKAASYTDAKTITSGPVKILMCGDSLMRTYVSNSSDQTGWGQVLSQFLTDDVTVDNTYPNGGRSSRSFYNEVGRWDQVKAQLAAAKTAGTPAFVFIMFGHNDQKKVTDTNGPDYLTFASKNPNGSIAGTYYDYLERYIVEARELGGIPILFTPFVREYLAGSPATVTAAGQHNITAPYAGELTARGDYPAAMKAIAAKHDVPLVDITAWSKTMVEEHAAASTLEHIYISSDQTHVRYLGAMLMAQEAIESLNLQGILTSYTTPVATRVMLDTGTLSFGGVFDGDTLDKSFLISAFGDATGTISINAPDGYTISTDGSTYGSSATITCDASYTGSKVSVRFAPTATIAYNADLTVTHSSLTPDYGNTVPNATAGVVSLTGNGKDAANGAAASATWAMFSGATIVLDPTTIGAINATTATLTGLKNKNVANNAARFDVLSGMWPAEVARAADRYVEFTVPVANGTFTLTSVSVDAGSGGGSNVHWDIVYSLAPDFSSPTDLGTNLSGTKDTLSTNTYPGLGVSISAGQTLLLRVYPYSTTAATGKSIMLANVVVSGVTN